MSQRVTNYLERWAMLEYGVPLCLAEKRSKGAAREFENLAKILLEYEKENQQLNSALVDFVEMYWRHIFSVTDLCSTEGIRDKLDPEIKHYDLLNELGMDRDLFEEQILPEIKKRKILWMECSIQQLTTRLKECEEVVKEADCRCEPSWEVDCDKCNYVKKYKEGSDELFR